MRLLEPAVGAHTEIAKKDSASPNGPAAQRLGAKEEDQIG
jgi:hypothetical protein